MRNESTPLTSRDTQPAELLGALILELTRDEDAAVRQWAARLLESEPATLDVTKAPPVLFICTNLGKAE